MGEAGMMRAAMAALVLLAAACGPVRTTYRDLDQIGDTYAREGASPLAGDTCHIAEHRNLMGVRDEAIDRASLPPDTRLLCFACTTPTMDTPSRLNLQIGANHTVTSMRCG
jgi:hypothetical protein